LWVGLAFIVLGVLALIFPFVTTLSVTLVIGALLAISGAVMVVHSFSSRPLSHLALALIWGVVTLLGGLAALIMPVGGAVALSTVLAAMFAINGVTRIGMALMEPRPPRWGMTLVGGLLSLALAGMVIFSPIPAALTFPGILVGVDLVFAGFTLLAMRGVAKAVQSNGAGAA
jgi:uncharacterized membrane protein HdeD (DUF308 family)